MRNDGIVSKRHIKEKNKNQTPHVMIICWIAPPVCWFSSCVDGLAHFERKVDGNCLLEERQIVQDKISIVVPVYKVEKELDRCVQSLLGQTYENIEIILVDDGSPDSCPVLCDKYAQKDSRIQVIHKENGGLSDARNAGLKQATGKYILYVDSDDYIEPDTCERFLEATNGQTVDLVVGNAKMEKPDGCEMMIHSATPGGKIYTAKDFIQKAVPSHQWFAPAWLNLYRKDFLLENDLYYKKDTYFEDTQMLPRVFLQAKKIACMEGIFYHYVVRDGSIMTSAKNEKKKADAIEILKEWKRCFDAVQDTELKKYLYGMLLKCYLHECRVYGIKTHEITGVNNRFLLKYSLGIREKLKSFLFILFPDIFVKL